MKSQDHGREFFAALDIGTDKVLCIVARPGAEPGSMRVIGMGNARSSGVQEGCVVDVQEAVQSIRKAVQEAQYTAEVQLSGVWAALEAVSVPKQMRLSGAAVYYLMKNGCTEIPCRFDVIGIAGNKISLRKNAFEYCGDFGIV